ncbi:MAG: hypothetical protein HY554_06295 [Elusimicrobia bacterium]|nr:hypothetical protein [Elusimicrobiota bacterium]
MILPALVALLVAGGPLLRGSFELATQSALHLVVVAGLTAWLLSRVAVGFLPLPSNRLLVWSGALACLSWASAWSSPVHGLARSEWYAFLEGLWIFAAMAALSKDERTGIDQAVRASAWVLMSLAFYQHFTLGVESPASALPGPSVYAGAVLMLLPLAVERGDWLLGLGLLWTLCWAKSPGAWFGLAAAVAVTQRRAHPVLARAGAAVALGCAVILYGRLDSPEVAHRWGWWRAAWAMAADRPLTGFGPGAFAHVLPAYRELAPGALYGSHAHQYLLEVLAGFGVPFALLWFAGLWRSIMSEGHYKRFAVIAVLIQSLWDYTLSVPSNLWLFCYCAASPIPDTGRGVNIPSPYKPVAATLTLAAGLALGGRVLAAWSAEQHLAAAQVALENGDAEGSRRRLAAARRSNPAHSGAPRLAAALDLQEAAAKGGAHGALLAAAAELEHAARLNPFLPGTWTQLAGVYRALGRDALAQETERRAGRVR